ncbi:hypothetical protein [Streptomyces sp. NPDC002133]|uniref:hypothetical protein n=1 Tax=Streptomyces sp. NPDC002133 TaxID=3154409 RepID=UPI003325AA26
MDTAGTGAELARLSERDRNIAEEPVERARRGGLHLVGDGGLLPSLSRMVLEGALEAELNARGNIRRSPPWVS